MIGLIIVRLVRSLMFFLPVIIGYFFAIYGLTLENSWLSLAAVVLGILAQIATIVLTPENLLPDSK